MEADNLESQVQSPGLPDQPHGHEATRYSQMAVPKGAGASWVTSNKEISSQTVNPLKINSISFLASRRSLHLRSIG